jgi:hypothetical protein
MSLNFYFLHKKQMKYRIDCSECWTRHTVYVKSLNTGLIQALWKLIEYYKRTRLPANLQEDLDLTHNQYAWFQQLQYFNLVDHDIKNSRIPSVKWLRFRNWEVPCENRVATFKNKVVPYDHECRATDKKKRHALYIREYDWQYKYKQKEEYQQEKWYKRERTEQVLFELWG